MPNVPPKDRATFGPSAQRYCRSAGARTAVRCNGGLGGDSRSQERAEVGASSADIRVSGSLMTQP
jgi:hypothetical protein